MVGYVEEIIGTCTYLRSQKNENFKVFKFILNNNNGSIIQVNIYEKNIDLFAPLIKLHEVCKLF